MSEIVDITVGVIQEEITISAVNNIGEVTVNAVNNSEEINITANTNLIQININTAPISIINPQDYDLSEFTNTSSNPFIRQSTLSSYVPISRTITINGITLDLSADRSWTIPAAVWGSITGTLSSQTDLQAALDAKQDDLTLTTTGSSGAATLIGATLNIPNYTISGLGGVPSSRTLTINGTSYDLSADRSWTISTGITIGTTAITSGVVGRVLFEGVGNVVQESADLFWDNVNGRLGLGTSNPTARLQVNGTATIQNGSSRGLVFTPWTLGANIDPVTASNNLYFGRDVAFSNVVFQSGNILVNTTTDAGYKLDVNGTLRVSGDTSIVGSIIQTNASFTGTHTITFIGNNAIRFTNSAIGHYMTVGPSNIVNFEGQRLYATQRGAIFGNIVWASSIVGLTSLVAQSSGTSNTAGIEINYAINNTGTYSGITRGIYYNPTLTSLTGTTHIAIETVTGNVIFGSTSGSVGIGTSTPASPLDVNGQIQSNLGLNLDRVSGQTQIYFRENGTLRTQLTSNYADGNFYLYHGGANRLVVATSGNVGIGTISPSSTLQVNGTFNSLALWTNVSGITSWGNSGSVAFGGLTWGTGYAMVYSTSGNTLNFGTNGTTTRMTISTAGNVSIGDSVFPSAAWTNALTIGPNGTNKIITGYLSSSTNGAVIGAHSSALNAWADLNIVADAIIFRRLGEVEAMRIANTGNVLIGTTTDAGFKLDVNGTLRAGSTTISSSVFNVLSTGSSLFFVDSGSNNYRVANLITWGGYHPGAGTNNTGDIFSVGSNPSSSANNSPFFRLNFNGGNSGGIYGSSGNNSVIAQLNATTSANLYVTAQGAGGLVQGSTSGFLISTISDGQNLSLRSEKGTGNSGGGINYLSSLNGSNHSHRWYHNNTEQMRLWYTGNLTIQNGGTFTDAGYKLDVVGTARVSTSVESLEFRTDAGGNNFYRTAEIFMQSAIVTGLITSIAQRALIVQNVNNGTNRDGALFSIGPVSSLSIPQQNMYFNRLLGTLQLYNGGAQNFDSTANLASSILSLESTTKGFLPPRMTTIQKNAIATPATGLLVYDTDLNTLSSFNGTVWSTIGGSVAWGSITGTLSAQTDLQSALDTKVPYTGATGNVDLGEYELKAGQVTLDITPTGTAAVGTTRWNDSIGSSETTLKGGNVVLKNGVDLVARVVNKVTPNATLLKANYTAVRISGAQGQRLAVEYAQANSDLNSADTIGLVAEDIATNQEGFVVTVGELLGINTTGALQSETWADGDVLYLSPTTPGAVTNIKPTGATGHIVVLGYVVYSHAVNGKIYVKIMNGWELDELHNVYINPATLANGDTLIYDSSTSLWKNGAGGGGGGGSIIKLTGQTLAVGSWSLVGSYYQYTFSNANITANTRVDFTPNNTSYDEVTTCGMLPQVDEAAGSCTFYSLFPPQSDIIGEILIIPTI